MIHTKASNATKTNKEVLESWIKREIKWIFFAAVCLLVCFDLVWLGFIFFNFL